jgi:hypothetical protein
MLLESGAVARRGEGRTKLQETGDVRVATGFGGRGADVRTEYMELIGLSRHSWQFIFH